MCIISYHIIFDNAALYAVFVQAIVRGEHYLSACIGNVNAIVGFTVLAYLDTHGIIYILDLYCVSDYLQFSAA